MAAVNQPIDLAADPACGCPCCGEWPWCPAELAAVIVEAATAPVVVLPTGGRPAPAKGASQ